MLISVSELLKLDNSTLPISVEVDLKDVSFHPLSVTFSEPVLVNGVMKNAGGVITLEATAEGKYNTLCDRCAKEIGESISFEVRENFVKDSSGLENDPEAIVLQGQAFDIKDVLSRTAFAAIPLKHLCSEDCKGICPNCGVNLNEQTCDCKDDEWAPRFEVLRG